MMQMLVAGGLPALTDGMRSADENNPRGYLEFEPVKRLRTDRSWLPDARGRAVKIIYLLLRELPTDGAFTYQVILMKRPIEEILASQRAMLQRDGKVAADEATLTKIYQSQVTQIEQWLDDQHCFSSLSVAYHRILDEAAAVAQEVSKFLELELDVTAMASAVDPALYRQRGKDKP
jgi:hypothetical protein